jgi:hypothetical protein
VVSSPRAGLVLIMILTAGLLAGCGSGRLITHQRAAVRQVGGSQDAAQVAVIRAWASALQRGDISAAARYFALPSVFANGGGANGGLAAVVIHTERQAREINESLSCGAALVSTTPHGKYIQAFFRLTNRSGAGADCGSGTGESASTDFVITHGHIVEWIRAPTTSGGAPPKIPTVPTSTTPAQPV